MVAVAVAAPAAMVAGWTWDRCRQSGQTFEVLVAVVMGGAVGLGAMRHPWVFLPIAIVIGSIPHYAGRGFNTEAAVEYGLIAGAFIGAPVGLLSRFVKRLRASPSETPPPSEPADGQ